MGPRHEAVEDAGHDADGRSSLARASMGPRPMAVEDRTWPATAAGRDDRLQWGHGLRPWKTATVIGPDAIGFNGATARSRGRLGNVGLHDAGRLQWGHGREAVEDRRARRGRAVRRCFNGATAREAVEDTSVPRAPARLYSLQWGHGTLSRGRPALPRSSRPDSVSFNGATARDAVEDWRSLPIARRRRTSRFNGATACRPWKTRSTRRR